MLTAYIASRTNGIEIGNDDDGDEHPRSLHFIWVARKWHAMNEFMMNPIQISEIFFLYYAWFFFHSFICLVCFVYWTISFTLDSWNYNLSILSKQNFSLSIHFIYQCLYRNNNGKLHFILYCLWPKADLSACSVAPNCISLFNLIVFFFFDFDWSDFEQLQQLSPCRLEWFVLYEMIVLMFGWRLCMWVCVIWNRIQLSKRTSRTDKFVLHFITFPLIATFFVIYF